MSDEHQERKALISGAEITLTGRAIVLVPLTRVHCGPLENVAGEFASRLADYPHCFVPLNPPEVAAYVARRWSNGRAASAIPSRFSWMAL